MLNVGTAAPDFALPDQDGTVRRLGDFRGRKVVLYFYPKDGTSGCTKQACGFSELRPLFSEKGAAVLGVSKDSVDSHRKFAQKYNLSFPLLSDGDLSVVQAYDVWKEKSMYGRKFFGVVRTTYVIDETGVIVRAEEKVNAAQNPSDVLSAL